MSRNEGQHTQSTDEVASGKRIPRDRPWWHYPVGTKAPAVGGGHWVREKGGWRWHNGDLFPTPGGDNMDQVILPAPALPDASRLRINRGEQALSEAMQDVWNDRCIDIGEVPTCFEIHGPKTTRITADFIDSAFVRDIVETMNARGYTIQPAPVPSETITVGRSVGKSWVGPAPSEPVALPVWNGIGETGSTMPIPEGSKALTAPAPSERVCPRCCQEHYEGVEAECLHKGRCGFVITKPSATPDECDDLATLQRAERAERELAEARAEIERLSVAIQAATVMIAAKGRHNTFLAYNGLRAAIAAVKGGKDE